ncbi:F-box domain-containing protein [Caenorhabditis elegans]|uniref:F-box domain-containing protein n=1 Tax=Caenorhabditis elegans TaxID=6239 RepID=A0A0M7RF88_CAEEL|nr:F-box domain-containing protein [Caenorhabditis elegans]CUR29993.1 F-box domain-containing protein [Caenorhabditis elegans]|eukprot:NP_001303798.1 Uncharacterized protein CELE_W08F4.12 [Caenorhabditis elegans]
MGDTTRTPFPLLLLPQEIISITLRQMCLIEQFSISLLSAKAKTAVARVNGNHESVSFSDSTIRLRSSLNDRYFLQVQQVMS